MADLEIIQPHEVADAIAQERESREFRPTAMILAHTVLDPETGLINFVSVVSSRRGRSYKPATWWFSQGGIDDDETAEEGASRELGEEILEGIEPTDPGDFTILGAIRDHSSRPRDGYKSNGKGGKLLIACIAPVTSKGKLKPNPNENVAKASWFEAKQLQETLADNIRVNPRKELKARFSIAMIDLTLENLAK